MNSNIEKLIKEYESLVETLENIIEMQHSVTDMSYAHIPAMERSKIHDKYSKIGWLRQMGVTPTLERISKIVEELKRESNNDAEDIQ